MRSWLVALAAERRAGLHRWTAHTQRWATVAGVSCALVLVLALFEALPLPVVWGVGGWAFAVMAVNALLEWLCRALESPSTPDGARRGPEWTEDRWT